MSTHHRYFSPSASSRWLECTASPKLIADLPDTTSEAAAEGTLAHQLFENRMTDAGGPMSLGEGQYVVDGFEFEITKEMVQSVDESVGYVRSLGEGVVMTEVAVELFIDRDTITGTADVLVQPHDTPHVLHVLDFKYGKGVKVYAKRNPQMMLYAAGSLATHALLYEDITEVTVHVLQPRLDHYDQWTISAEDLWNWVLSVVAPAVGEVLRDEGVFRPSASVCRWCPLSGECKAQADMVASAFDDLGTSPAVGADETALSAQQLGDLLAQIDDAMPLVKAMQARAESLALAGTRVPGWKVVEGRSTRQWPEDVEPKLLAIQHDYPELESVYAPPKVLSPAQLEKAVGKKVFATSDFAELVVKPRGKPVLVREEDGRPEWQEVSAEDFDNLEIT